MGYDTKFRGQFNLDHPLTVVHKIELEKFANERHGNWDPHKGMPGLYCQWIPNKDGTAIVYDGNEKFYDYVEWIEYLINKFLKPWGYVVNGEVYWQGDKVGDVGLITVKNNEVSAKSLFPDLNHQ